MILSIVKFTIKEKKYNAVIVFDNGIICAKHKDKIYPVLASSISVKGCTKVYSRPENTAWSAWKETTQSNPNGLGIDIANKWWSRVKPKMKVYGRIYKDNFVDDMFEVLYTENEK